MGRKLQQNRHRVPFVIGRLTPATAEIVLVDDPDSAPATGPWFLRALVRPSKAVRFADA